jgi:hypothetical protein
MYIYIYTHTYILYTHIQYTCIHIIYVHTYIFAEILQIQPW